MFLCSNRSAKTGTLLALSLLAWQFAASLARAEAAPKTPADCQTYAARQADEEYLAQRTSNRENSPFARSPSGMRDPLQQNANQQADINRAGRQQQLYDDCVAKLSK